VACSSSGSSQTASTSASASTKPERAHITVGTLGFLHAKLNVAPLLQPGPES
jgi:hypothetical protein